MPRQTAPVESEPRPTRTAFRPAAREDIRNSLILAGICLGGFLFGLGANLLGNFHTFLDSTSRMPNNELTPIWLQVFIFFGYPLFLVAAGYFLRQAWIQRRETKRFEQNHILGEAVVTHLWKEPPSGSGKKYYLGYRTAGNQTARQEVSVFEFKRLQVGQTLVLDFLPDQPQISCVHIPRPGKRLAEEGG